FRLAAHQAPPARGRSRRQDRREDGLPAGLLHLSGDLGRDDRSCRHQVRAGPHPACARHEIAMAVNSLAQVATDELAAPPLPRTVAETGLSVDQIEQLMLKTLHTGELTGVTLAERVCLPYSLLEPLIERLRAERLVEVRGATGSGTAGYRYALTDLGRDRATQFLEINRYVGPAPVSLASYIAVMDTLRQARPDIDRERLGGGFAHAG